MAGVVFVKTKDLSNTVQFYLDVIGCEKWISQPDIEIIKSDNFLIGFHQAEDIDNAVLFSFFYKTRKEVDLMYDKMMKLKLTKTKPTENSKYKIYNFLLRIMKVESSNSRVFFTNYPP